MIVYIKNPLELEIIYHARSMFVKLFFSCYRVSGKWILSP